MAATTERRSGTVEVGRVQTVERPVELDETGRVLLKAADLVRERWQQGYEQRKGQWSEYPCMAVAIAQSGGDFQRHVGRVYNSLGLTEMHEMFAWNDKPGRTKEEVAEALERAAYGV